MVHVLVRLNLPTSRLHPSEPSTIVERFLYPSCRRVIDHCRVVMAAFSAIQPFADALLFFLPLYFPAKLAFACYLWVNNLAGTELVYTKYVEPVVTKYEPLVDRQIAEAREMVTDLVSRTFSRAVRWLQTKITAALANAHQSAQQNGEEKSVRVNKETSYT